jgi:hypothetical protein
LSDFGDSRSWNWNSQGSEEFGGIIFDNKTQPSQTYNW